MQCILNAKVHLIYAILVILVQGANGGMNLAVLERTLFKPWSICLKLRTITYVTHAQTFIFILFCRKEGYAGYGKWGGEHVFIMQIALLDIAPGYCRWPIYMIHTKCQVNCGRNICWEGGMTYWAAGALLMNPMTSWTQSNITICANTLVYDGALIFIYYLNTTEDFQLSHGFSIISWFWWIIYIMSSI